ncbi:hypothetical protein G6F33_009732 [Rhizopus arrhizus]|nr:hypothetical protein G6F23_012457 [Rhizopus arrhizus]KAG0761361.1 hypothetical protein G6F24_007626 [Rhizopus arrhizus]KAG0908390.1 hypothetical protein G6F33_009732 [Rhizopus arrhizus]
MRSVLVSFGLLSVFMLVSSLPLGPATLEKRQGFNPNDLLGSFSNGFLSGVPGADSGVTDAVSGVTDVVSGVTDAVSGATTATDPAPAAAL